MPYCSKCGNKVDDAAAFCSACGERIVAPSVQRQIKEKSNEQVNQPGQVYVSSRSCKALLEDGWQKSQTARHTASGFIVFIIGALTFGPWILAYLRDEPEYKIAKLEPSVGTCILMLALMAAVLIFFSWLFGKVKETYDTYLSSCRRETLSVESTGIFGASASSSLKLAYEDVASVSVIASTEMFKWRVINNEVLIINEKNGRRHVFIAFTNATELANMIRRCMK